MLTRAAIYRAVSHRRGIDAADTTKALPMPRFDSVLRRGLRRQMYQAIEIT